MAIEIPKEAKTQAVASIERWFRENRDEKIGNLAAADLLNLFLEDIAPVIFNQAVADVQERLQARVAEIDIEVHETPFGYWQKFDRARKKR